MSSGVAPTASVGPEETLPQLPAAAGRLSQGLRWQLGWEGVLVLLTVAASVFMVRAAPSAVTNDDLLRVLRQDVAILLPMTAALALSMRAGVPNLAVGAILWTSASVYLTVHASSSAANAVGVVVLLALVTGGVLAVLVAVFRAPGWAASLVVVLGLIALNVHLAAGRPADAASQTSTQPISTAWVWTLAVVAVLVSIAGGVLCRNLAVRQELGAAREFTRLPDRSKGPEVEFLRSRGMASIMIVSLLSTAAAAAAGVIAAMTASGPIQTTSDPAGLNLTLIALAAALLGGPALFGPAAAIAGTAVATLLISIGQIWLEFASASSSAWSSQLALGVYCLVGVVVGRALAGLSDATPDAVRPGVAEAVAGPLDDRQEAADHEEPETLAAPVAWTSLDFPPTKDQAAKEEPATEQPGKD